jgi:hypothetical protein
MLIVQLLNSQSHQVEKYGGTMQTLFEVFVIICITQSIFSFILVLYLMIKYPGEEE